MKHYDLQLALNYIATHFFSFYYHYTGDAFMKFKNTFDANVLRLVAFWLRNFCLRCLASLWEQHPFFLRVVLLCGCEAALCLWQMSGSSIPLYCHQAANPIFNLIVLQAFPFSFSRKEIPIEIPEATFSVSVSAFLYFSSLNSQRGVGAGLPCSWKLIGLMPF